MEELKKKLQAPRKTLMSPKSLKYKSTQNFNNMPASGNKRSMTKNKFNSSLTQHNKGAWPSKFGSLNVELITNGCIISPKTRKKIAHLRQKEKDDELLMSEGDSSRAVS